MVIEAKTYLARTPEGEWLTHPHGPPKERSPFQQAGNAMHRVKEWVRTHGRPNVLTACVVIVPDMEVSAGRDQIEWSARRAVESGRRVLLVCFNRLLGEWLQGETASLGSACTGLGQLTWPSACYPLPCTVIFRYAQDTSRRIRVPRLEG